MNRNSLHLDQSIGSKLRVALGATLIALGVALTSMAPAQAAGLVVNSTNDVNNGACNVAHCSLREAIIAANGTPGADTITFSLGQAIIAPTTPLPALTSDHTTINGGGQITLDGSIGGIGIGLQIKSSYNHIYGLTIAHFAGDAIEIGNGFGNTVATYNIIGTNGDGVNDAAEHNVLIANGSSGVEIDGPLVNHNMVAGNYIGVQADGLTADPNQTGVKIYFSSSYNIIGSNGDNVSDALERNVISGNTLHGVYVEAEFNLIARNYIGNDVTGKIAVGNGGEGVMLLYADGNQIGPGNIISANESRGILIDGSSFNTIIGNKIGTDVTGTQPLGNEHFGIEIQGVPDIADAHRNMIGAVGNYLFDFDANPNIIAFNAWQGIAVDKSAENMHVNENAILYNSIFSNGGIGIELVPTFSPVCWDGVTANDSGDVDGGGNDAMNHPDMISATADAAHTYTKAQITDGLPNMQFIIQFFASPTCDPSGFGEGKTFLGEVTITTDSSGDATTFNVALPPMPVGQFVTATATQNGALIPLSTSEFSACMQITQAPKFTGSIGAIYNLLQYLNNLVDERQLDAEVARSLDGTLNAALEALKREDGKAAAAQMEYFIRQVDEDVRSRAISEEIGRQLTSDASDILRLMGSE